MGRIDKITRTLIAVVLLILVITGVFSGVPAILSIALAVVFLLTSIIGTCPLYLLFGINTIDKASDKKQINEF